jgi:hypothetical protein
MKLINQMQTHLFFVRKFGQNVDFVDKRAIQRGYYVFQQCRAFEWIHIGQNFSDQQS